MIKLLSTITRFLQRQRALGELRALDRQDGYLPGSYFKDEIARAADALAAGDSAQATRIWKDIRRIFPDESATSGVALRLLLDIGLFDEVEAMMIEGRRRYPSYAHFAIGYAQVACRRGDLEKALQRCKMLRAKFSDAVEGYTVAIACLTSLGRNEEAGELIDLAVREFPHDFEVQAGHARYAMRRNDWPEALRRWEAIQSGFADPAISLSIAECLRVMGRYADAEERVTWVSNRIPGNVGIYFELARIADAKGDVELAVERWETVRRRYPFGAVGYVGGADALRRADREAEADALLHEGVTRLTTILDVHLEYSRAAQRRGDWPEALARWALVRARFPDCDEARREEAAVRVAAESARQSEVIPNLEPLDAPVVSCDERNGAAAVQNEGDHLVDTTVRDALATARSAWLAGEPDRSRAAWSQVAVGADELMAEARALIASGHPDAAEELLTITMAHGIASGPMSFEHGMLAYWRGDHETAARRFVSTVRRFPDHTDAWALGLRTLRGLGQFEEAAALAAESLRAQPESAGVLIEAAAVAEVRHELSIVRTLCDKVRQLNPEGPDAYIMEARASRTAGELDAAASVLALAAGVSNRHPSLLTEAAMIAEARKDFGELERIAAALRQEFPSSTEGYEIALRGYLAADDLDAAEALFASLPSSIAEQPPFVRHGCNLAMRRLDHEQALVRCTDAVTRFPGAGEFHVMMTIALRNVGRAADAEAFVEAALSRFPRDARLAMEFARGAEIRGDRETALQRWENVRTQFPEMPDGYVYSAGLMLALGRYNEAEAISAAGHVRFPNEPWIAVQRGRCAARRLDWPEASVRWEAALLRFPRMPEIVADMAAARMSIALNLAEKDKGPEIGALPADDESLRQLVMRFESLGSNCEFGIVQRLAGAEPLGLLRWGNIGPLEARRMIETGFEGVGQPETTQITLSSSGEYQLSDPRYFSLHTLIYTGQMSEDQIYIKMQRRLQFLSRKLMDDIVAGEKIFVYRQHHAPLLDIEINGLFDALRIYGPGRLLCVHRPTDPALDNTLLNPQPGLFIAYMSALNDDPTSAGNRFELWIKLLREVEANVTCDGEPYHSGKDR